MITIRIAIADDHPLIRQKLVSIVKSFPDFSVVLEASNGEELLNRLETESSLPDICVLDINMPVLNGYETVEEIRKRWKNLKVLALSFSDTESAIKKVFTSGANGFILKDSPFRIFSAAIRKIYEGGSYFPDAIMAAPLQAAEC